MDAFQNEGQVLEFYKEQMMQTQVSIQGLEELMLCL